MKCFDWLQTKLIADLSDLKVEPGVGVAGGVGGSLHHENVGNQEQLNPPRIYTLENLEGQVTLKPLTTVTIIPTTVKQEM